MSKEIQLYSKDNKYKCAIELADSKDRFGCPDHSRIMLFEERDDKIYLIADAKDRLLETEKDKRIAELEKDLEFTTKTANELIEIKHKLEQELNSKNMLCENYNCGLNKKIQQLQQELADTKSYGLALYSTLYEQLEKEDIENVSSRISFLTGNKKSLYDNTYKTIKNLQEKIKELKGEK